MLALRQEVSRALEQARAAKLIGSSLEARVLIEAPAKIVDAISATEDPEGFFIVSHLDVETGAPVPDEAQEEDQLAGVRVQVFRVEADKCPRCWVWTSDVGSDKDYPQVCARCAGVLRESGIRIEEE